MLSLEQRMTTGRKQETVGGIIHSGTTDVAVVFSAV